MISISGTGIICNLGTDPQSVIDNLSFFTDAQSCDNIKYPLNYDGISRRDLCQVAEVSMSNKDLYNQLNIECKKFSNISRSELMAIYAIQQAIGSNNDKLLKYDKKFIGLFCGTSQAATTRLEKFYKDYKLTGKAHNLHLLLSGTYNIPNQTIAKHFGLSSSQACISTACSSSLVALYLAHAYIITNQIDAAIVYGVDPISELVIGGFKSLQAIASNFSTPFSDTNIGMSIGEGAAAVFIEKKSDDPIAFINGIGCSSDAYHLTAPDPIGTGAYHSIACAYNNHNSSSVACDVIYAHGSGTQANDECEANALLKYFGQKSINNIPVLSIKGAVGHTLGAAGMMNVVLAASSIKSGIIPRSPGFKQVRPGCEKIKINTKTQTTSVSHALVNAFGFGGNNASVLLSKYGDIKEKHTTHLKPVNITSFGFICSIGDTIEDLYKHVFFEQDIPITGSPIISFTKRFESLGSSNVNNLQKKIDKKIRKLKNFRKLDRLSKLVVYSALETIEKAKLKRIDKEALPIILGTGTGPMESIHKFYDELIENGIEAGNPGLFPNNVMNGCLGYLSIEENIKGPTILCSDHELSSANAFRNSWLLLNKDASLYTRVLTGGADEYSEILEKGYLDLMQVKTKFRDGYILGELAACFLFENEHQQAITACNPHAVYIGGYSCYPNQNFDTCMFKKQFSTFLTNMIANNDQPDLILFGSKNNRKHDAYVLNIINKIIPNVPYYSSVEKFGYQQGCVTALNFLLTIMFFQYQRFPGTTEMSSCQINKVFVITISDGIGITVDILCRKKS